MDQQPQQRDQDNYMGTRYALSGKIMLSAIVILFFIVVLMVGLHLYARWYLLRGRRRQLSRARHRRTHLVFYVDPDNPNSLNTANPPRGLDSQVVKSLPVFIYSKQTNPEPIECSVCLSEFEENESGRVLPKCNHSFHVECIDMWFHSHSTCPLCRSPVEPVNQDSSREIDSCSSHELCDSCQLEETSEASTSERRKPVELTGVTIEVPRTNGGLVNESLTDSPSQGTRSPMSRMLSFTRILSWDRRGGNGLPSPGVSGSGTVTEVDIERGKDVARETRG